MIPEIKPHTHTTFSFTAYDSNYWAYQKKRVEVSNFSAYPSKGEPDQAKLTCGKFSLTFYWEATVTLEGTDTYALLPEATEKATALIIAAVQKSDAEAAAWKAEQAKAQSALDQAFPKAEKKSEETAEPEKVRVVYGDYTLTVIVCITLGVILGWTLL